MLGFHALRLVNVHHKSVKKFLQWFNVWQLVVLGLGFKLKRLFREHIKAKVQRHTLDGVKSAA